MKAKLIFTLCTYVVFSLLSCSPKVQKMNDSKKEQATSKLHHIVLFNFKNNAPIDSIESAMYELFGSIKEVHDLSFNKNVSSRGNLDKGYKYSFYMTFDSEFARDSVFYTHPNYKKIGGIIGPHINEYLIYDYWIPEKK
jgi:hypothetical protein